MPNPLGFLDSLDIANRAAQHLGQPRILSPDEETKMCSEATFAYDKLRQAELQRNTWTFSTRRVILRPVDAATFLLVPNDWDATVTYAQGSIVADTNGVLWASTIPNNLNNDPIKTIVWEQYFGPLTVTAFNSASNAGGYFAGELVYLPLDKPGSFAIFMSLQNGNLDTPTAVNAWDATILYNKGETVGYGGSQWQSLIELNQNITPADAPLAFDPNSVYSSGQTTLGSDGYIYTSITNNNAGHDPVTDGGANWSTANVPAAWSRMPIIFPSSIKWLPILGGLQNLVFTYPIGAGPITDQNSRNAFKLPAGFLRVCSQSPKAGSISLLGASTGLPYNDWEFENGYLVSSEVSYIMLRFIADMKDVSRFHPMFCEGLAARLAYEICEPVTQSASKKGVIAGDYTKFMNEARTINAIEAGSEEPPIDDWESCRL